MARLGRLLLLDGLGTLHMGLLLQDHRLQLRVLLHRQDGDGLALLLLLGGLVDPDLFPVVLKIGGRGLLLAAEAEELLHHGVDVFFFLGNRLRLFQTRLLLHAEAFGQHGAFLFPALLRLAALFDDVHHHALDLAEVIVFLFEDRLRAGAAAQVLVVHAAFQHDLQLFRALVTVLGLEGRGLLQHLAKALAGSFGHRKRLAAHAGQLPAGGSRIVRELPLVQAVDHKKGQGINVRRGAGVSVPVHLRRYKLQLLAGPFFHFGGTHGKGAVFVPADVFGKDAAMIGAGAHLGLQIQA